MLKHLMNATALASLVAVLGLIAVAIAPAQAGVNCSNKTDNINGKLGGAPFGFSADTRNFIGDDNNFARLQSEDCVNDDSAARDAFKDAKRDARRSAGVAAAMDAYGEQPGLNLTLNYANIGLEDDVNAAGAVLGYRQGRLRWRYDLGRARRLGRSDAELWNFLTTLREPNGQARREP